MSQLGFDFGEAQPRKLIKISPAKLSAFQHCPRRFQLTYLQQAAATGTVKRTGPWAHSTLGAVVHNVLHTFFRLPALKRTAARVANLLTQHWKDGGFADERQAAVYRERAHDWLTRYVEHHDVTETPFGLERWISARISTDRSAAPTNVRPASMIIEGRADRIDHRNGELVIVEYKTGRSTPGEEDARKSAALALYAIGAEKNFRISCRRVELHHLPSGVVAAVEHTEDSLAEHVRAVTEIADNLESATAALEKGANADSVFPARAGNWCAWCDFRPSCSSGQQAAPAARPWDLLAVEPSVIVAEYRKTRESDGKDQRRN